jgi:hypothetical protein
LSEVVAGQLTICSTAAQDFVELSLLKFASGHLGAHFIQGRNLGKFDNLECSIEGSRFGKLIALPSAWVSQFNLAIFN